jgi:hypothetical protein
MSYKLRLVLSALVAALVGSAVSDEAEAGCFWLEQPRYHTQPAGRAIPGGRRQVPVSREITRAISPQIAGSITPWNCLSISSPDARKRAVNRVEERQYQLADAKNQRQGAMLELGALLGLVYVAFLVCWFWATRLRRGSRH